MTLSTISDERDRLVWIQRIFKYNLDWGSIEFMMSSESTLFRSLMYFSIILRLEAIATLLVVMSSFLLSDQIKSMEISDFTLFKSLLMLETWMFIFAITFSELFDPIGMITCFFERLFVIILSLGFF